MKDTLKFLKIYNKNVKIMETDEFNDYLSYIPEKWRSVFQEKDREKRI